MTNQVKDSNHFDVAIVGGGIVGAATAYKLQLTYPKLKIAIIEKESRLAGHQTGNNSGVIHSGIYYKPGSYKALNCVDGRKQLVAFSKEHGIAHDVCGKLIVATEDSELPRLKGIFERGKENGIEGITMVSPKEIKDIEPYCEGVGAVWVPVTGIIDYPGATNKMGELMLKQNSESRIFLNSKVEKITKNNQKSILHIAQGNIEADKVVFCGGLHSDRLAKKDGAKPNMQIVGFRGDYYDLTEQAIHKVKNLIYPVPNPEFPFLGVHFTRMIHGGVECGPNAVFTFKREGYKKTDFDLRDTLQALSYTGTWKLFFKHTKFGIDEYRRAFSKRLFLKTLQRMIPSLTMDDIKPGRAGVRAMALGADGVMIDDFKIVYHENSIHVLNAPSPAATAALSIGDEVVKMAQNHFKLETH